MQRTALRQYNLGPIGPAGPTTMQATKTPRDQEEGRMKAHSLDFTGQTFSELELKNQKFKRIAWAAAFLLVGVVAVLILQLSGAINY